MRNQSHDTPAIPKAWRPQLGFTNLLSEALSGLIARPGRAALTALGAVLGIAALIATIGITQTASHHVANRFDAFTATRITIDARSSESGVVSDVMPWDIEARLLRLNGVLAAASITPANTEGTLTRRSPVRDALSRNEISLDYYAVSPGLLPTVQGKLLTGRFFDTGHSSRQDSVVVLGPAAAQRLQIRRVNHQPTIYVGDTPLVVIGILESVEDHPELLGAALITNGLAQRLFSLEAPTHATVRTEIGATQLVGSQVSAAINPFVLDQLRIYVPDQPQVVREGVVSDFNSLFLVLGGVSLLTGAIGIANVTLVSVLERVGEIGLRRSLGARRIHIASQFLTESTTTGFIGGVVGLALGLLVVVAVGVVNGWAPVIEPIIALISPAVGAVVGFLSGLYPAWRASMLEPVDAIRLGS